MLTTILVLFFGLVLVSGLVLTSWVSPMNPDVKEEDVQAGKYRIYKGEKFVWWKGGLDSIGGLLTMVGFTMIMFLSMSSESFLSIRRYMGIEESRPSVATAAFKEATCEFTSGKVTWKAPDHAIWVILNVYSGTGKNAKVDSFASPGASSTSDLPKNISEKVIASSKVGLHYGTVNGPSTEVIFEKK